MSDFIENYIKESIQIRQLILQDKNLLEKIQEVSNAIIVAYKSSNKVLLAGNGGSAADAQHIAAELVAKFYIERPALNAIALNANTSILTAIANDDSYDKIFSRQVQANGSRGDIFIGFSTSGNSKNIIEAIKEAKLKNMKTIGFVGQKECEMDKLCDVIIKIPSSDTPKIQESHIMLGHIICAIVEEKLFKK